MSLPKTTYWGSGRYQPPSLALTNYKNTNDRLFSGPGEPSSDGIVQIRTVNDRRKTGDLGHLDLQNRRMIGDASGGRFLVVVATSPYRELRTKTILNCSLAEQKYLGLLIFATLPSPTSAAFQYFLRGKVRLEPFLGSKLAFAW